MISISRLSKAYRGVHAIRDISLDLRGGEIHALCGENGAGKSTLIKCLAGVTIPDSGTIRSNDKSLNLGDIHAVESAGIAVIHQEATTFPDLNTIDNIFVGREPRKLGGWLLDRRRMRTETAKLLKQLGEPIDIRVPTRQLSVAQRQMVSMARALSEQCRLLIMDEPTASLSARETETLLSIVKQLREDGVSILYVSHRLEEVFELADRVTVLRDGQLVGTHDVAGLTKSKLIRMMVGRVLDGEARKASSAKGDLRLDVRNLHGESFRDISFTVRAGEVVGLAGLVGAGRSEVARALFGIDRYYSGSVLVDGKPIHPGNVRNAMSRGLGLVPEDRQHEGLILPMPVATNVSLSILSRLTKCGFINRRMEESTVAELMQQLDVRSSGQDVAVETLSGGNQQKVVLGKWLATNPAVLILDEPTRGVDVGAKSQVHALIGRLASQGMATLVISSELPELLHLCDRILVMREGRITGELSGAEATQDRILELALPHESS